MRVFVAAPALAVSLFVLARFLLWVEARPGSVLNDPVLLMFSPRDVNWVTFGFIYAGVIGGIVILSRHPERCVLAFQSYIVMVVFRIIAMALVPLDPPPGLIALKDPFVEMFGTGTTLTRDLFFSGHTSTLFLLFLVMPSKFARLVFFFCVLAVAFCVLLQHVHYGIDVFVAPFFTYCAYAIARGANARYFPIIAG